MEVAKRGRGEDVLMRYCTETGQVLTCNLCKAFKSGRDRRGNMRKHIQKYHSDIYSEEYEETIEDLQLKEEAQLVGLPTTGNMQWRKNACFQYNGIALRANWAFMVLSRKMWDKNQVPIDQSQEPGNDKFMDKSTRLNLGDFRGNVLPPGYQKGHLLARDFYRWSKETYVTVDILSLVGIQHRQLNESHYRALEGAAAGLTFHRKVRVLAGTVGELDLPCQTRVTIPRYWYYVIVSSDMNDENFVYSAHVFPNLECTEDLSAYEVSINDIIALSGQNVFGKIAHKMRTLLNRPALTMPFWDWVEQKWYPKPN